MASWLAMLLGAMVGFLAVWPDVLSSKLPEGMMTSTRNFVLMVQVGGFLLIGIFVAAFAGLWLRGMSALLRFLTALIALIVGLLASELVIVFEHVVAPPTMTLSHAVTLARQPGLEMAQLLMGMLGAFGGVRLTSWGRARSSSSTSAVEAVPRNAQATSSPAPSRSRRARQSTSPPPARQAQRNARRAAPVVNRIEVQPRAETPVRPKPTRARRFSRVKVRLGRTETSVCPYCLEEVLRNDPRGRRVCPICGAPHHGDCWAITGRCAVPHG